MAEKWKNRIVELRVVRAGDLIEDPRNWRRHPDGQRRAMQEVLDTVGWADTAIARETEDGLMLVDGHLRASLDDDEQIPVLIVDLSEEEAGMVMATMDPITSLIEIDTEALQALIDDMPQIPEAFGTLEWWPQPVPDFQPVPMEQQSRLDRKNDVECPECGHVFQP